MKKEIKVFFRGFYNTTKRREIEDAITNVVRSFEFERRASGFDIESNIRDVYYEKKD